MKSPWTSLLIMRPKKVRLELMEDLRKARITLEADNLSRYHRLLIMRRFDAFTQELDSYLRRLVLFAKPHWNCVWGMNLYIFMSKKTTDKCHNTAAMVITNVLWKFGEKHGYLKPDRKVME